MRCFIRGYLIREGGWCEVEVGILMVFFYTTMCKIERIK